MDPICIRCKVIDRNQGYLRVVYKGVKTYTIYNHLLSNKFEKNKYYILFIYKNIIFNFIKVSHG